MGLTIPYNGIGGSTVKNVLAVHISKWPLAAVAILLTLGVVSVLVGLVAWVSGSEVATWVIVFGLALLAAGFVVNRWYRF